MNNIILVCDDNSITEVLKSNLMLLRKLDYIFSTNFLNAETVIGQNKPQMIIAYVKAGDEKIFNLLKNVKDIPIFLILDKIDDEYIINVYDAGIDDYMVYFQSKTELMIRILQCYKKSVEHKKYKQYSDILKQIGILKDEFYSKKYTPAIFKIIIEKYLFLDVPTLLMGISPDIETKNRCSLNFLASILKQNLREDDIIGFCDDKILVILPNTNIQGGLDVYNKIKSTMRETSGIACGIVKLYKNMKFDSIIEKVDESLKNALLLKDSVVVEEKNVYDEVSWLDKSNKPQKNFKLFKKAFLKKIEKTISPVFYQKQKIAEQRLYEVEIEQYCNENKSRFCLKKDDLFSLLEITYPGAAKIHIDIYKKQNEMPERFSFKISEINEKMLGELLDKFILDFQRKDKE